MLIDHTRPSSVSHFLSEADKRRDPALPARSPNTGDPRLDEAVLIARETLATLRDLDNAHQTARLFRSGQWDHVSEMRNATLAARLALLRLPDHS